MQGRQQLIDQEVEVPDNQQLVSTTDLRGVITYANPVFCQVAGFSEQELVGHNHNIVRHPDMPKQAFADLWSKLKQGRSWRGMVKNRTQDGRYYWVDAYVTPLYQQGQHVGYQSVRVRASDELKRRATRVYAQFNRGKSADRWRSAVMSRWLGGAFLVGMLLLTTVLLGWQAGLLVALTAAGLAGCFFDNLFRIPAELEQMRSSFDSPSRLIYAGSSAFDVARFHIGLLEARVRTILGRTHDSTNALKLDADAIRGVAEVTHRSVEVESEQLQLLAAAMQQMSTTSHDIGQSTATASTRARETLEHCESARNSMQTSSESVQMLANDLERMADSAGELKAETDRINTILAEVQGISEQTNLLALNASIEAARAGEHGRGFAVVADEVRALSARSNDAAELIQQALLQIRTTLESWSQRVEDSRGFSRACVAESDSTLTLVDEIAGMAQEVSDLAFNITVAIEQQSTVTEEVSKNVEQINKVVSDTLNNAHQLRESSESLTKRSDTLASMSQMFG